MEDQRLKDKKERVLVTNSVVQAKAAEVLITQMYQDFIEDKKDLEKSLGCKIITDF